MVEGRERDGENRKERAKENLEKRKKDKETTEVECGGKRARGYIEERHWEERRCR